MRRALIIEDSPEFQILMRAALEGAFETKCADSAESAMTALISSDNFDLILLDVGLPGRDGISFCEELRRDQRWQNLPILLVTGRKDASDVVLGFAAGADDYVQKPFHPAELRARAEARVKKSGANVLNQDQFWKGSLRFMVGRQKVSHSLSGQGGPELELELTPNEFKILFHLAKNEGRTLSRGDILREVWGERLHVVERTVDKHICSLRRKMGDSSAYIASIPGQGYVFRVSEAAGSGQRFSSRAAAGS